MSLRRNDRWTALRPPPLELKHSLARVIVRGRRLEARVNLAVPRPQCSRNGPLRRKLTNITDRR